MLDRLMPKRRGGEQPLPAGEPAPQVGVVPYAMRDGVAVFLLVTTRRTGRWIFPKGGCERGESAADCAAREAFEEAGIEGRVAGAPVGAYRDRKVRARRADAVIEVAMYPFEVTRQHDDWPERDDRERHWVTLEQARALITTPGLIELAEEVAAAVAAGSAGLQRQQPQSRIQ